MKGLKDEMLMIKSLMEDRKQNCDQETSEFTFVTFGSDVVDEMDKQILKEEEPKQITN